MGLIDYISRNPVGIARPSSTSDEEFVVASINSFINNLVMIDNLILNQLANRKLAPYRLIKKRAENKGTVLSQPTSQPHSDHDIQCIRGQRLKPDPKLKTNHSLTTHFQIHSKTRD